MESDSTASVSEGLVSGELQSFEFEGAGKELPPQKVIYVATGQLLKYATL